MVIIALILAFSLLGPGCMFEAHPADTANGGIGAQGDGGSGGGGPEGGAGGGDAIGGSGGSNMVVVEQPACTPATEESDCPGTSCDPATLRCSTFKVASRGACWAT